MKMSRRKALIFMKFLVTANPDVSKIKVRFSDMAKSGHEDHGGALDMAKLREARDVLLDRPLHFEVEDCAHCAGTGKVRGTGFATVICKSCRGTGDRRKT